LDGVVVLLATLLEAVSAKTPATPRVRTHALRGSPSRLLGRPWLLV